MEVTMTGTYRTRDGRRWRTLSVDGSDDSLYPVWGEVETGPGSGTFRYSGRTRDGWPHAAGQMSDDDLVEVEPVAEQVMWSQAVQGVDCTVCITRHADGTLTATEWHGGNGAEGISAGQPDLSQEAAEARQLLRDLDAALEQLERRMSIIRELARPTLKPDTL